MGRIAAKAADAFAKAAFFMGFPLFCVGRFVAAAAVWRESGQTGGDDGAIKRFSWKNPLILWASARYRDQPYNGG
ncbi:hypothetical protein [Paraburkholderia sp. SIMBA_030]|uniref:hypothetical protein n=1 Tax=Paraburkholderia sp. SIMBA_030 TaxID=3085773 RepID=UPI0039786F72